MLYLRAAKAIGSTLMLSCGAHQPWVFPAFEKSFSLARRYLSQTNAFHSN
jgi:hypothetical protein